MRFSADITGPGGGVVHTEFGSAAGDAGLGHGDEGADDFHFRVGAEADGVGHGFHEVLAAVGIDRVVAGVGGDDEAVRFQAFRKSGGDGEHDAVAKWHDGPFHRLLFVVSLRNFTTRLQQVGREHLANESQPDFPVRHTQSGCVVRGEGNLAVVVFGPVVKADGADDFVTPMGLVKRGDGIHPAAQ